MSAALIEINDPVTQQIRPDALAIVERNGFSIERGLRDDGSPNFRGLPESWWRNLLHSNPRDFYRLESICKTDFPTYCALLLKVVSRLDLQLHPFIWNNGQRIVWNKMVQLQMELRMIFIIILKARQLGITTFVAAWHHWHLWKGENIRTLNVAHDKPLAERIVGFFRVFHDNLPDVGGLRPPLRAASKSARVPRSELYYSDRDCLGATYIADNMEPRGHTTMFIGEHEAAFYDDLYGFNDALLPQLPAIGSKARLKCSVLVESTPNAQNDFYDLWMQTKEEGSEAVGIFLPWTVHETEYSAEPREGWRMSKELRELQERLSHDRMKIEGKPVTRNQMYWYEMMLEQNGNNQEAFDMEYPSNDIDCFMLRSESLFHDSMRYLARSCTEAEMRSSKLWARRGVETKGALVGDLVFPPLSSPFTVSWNAKITMPKFDVSKGKGYFWIWEPPCEGHTYILGADVAGGEFNRDNSVGEIVCITCGRQAAELAGPIGPEDLADNLVHMATWYNKCMIMPELNGLGSVVMKRMANNWGYTNIAHEEKWDELGVKKNKPGWVTSEQNRPHIFSNLKWMIDERFVTVSSYDLVREMSTFKKQGMQYSTAKKGQPDDRVVAFGLALMAARQAPRLMLGLENARRERVPSAVDLGLNHASIPQFTIRGGTIHERDEVLEALTANRMNEMAITNPLRGYLDV